MHEQSTYKDQCYHKPSRITFFLQLFGQDCHIMTYFIHIILKQIGRVFGRLNELDEVFHKTHTFLSKVDELLYPMFVLLPWEEPFKKGFFCKSLMSRDHLSKLGYPSTIFTGFETHP